MAPPGPNFFAFNVVEAYDRIHVSANRSGGLDRTLVDRIATDFVADLGTGPIDELLWGVDLGSAPPSGGSVRRNSDPAPRRSGGR